MRRLVTIAALWPGLASADTVHPCHHIEDDRERLVCYDTMSERGATDVTPSRANVGWTIETYVDELTGKPITVATTVSEQPTPCNPGSRAVFHARCQAETVSIYINHGCYAPGVRDSPYGDQEMVEMKFRLDDNEPEMRWRQPDTTDRAFGTWTNKDSKYWIDALVGHEDMIVRFSPYRERPVTLAFDITGAEEVRDTLMENCPGIGFD